MVTTTKINGSPRGSLKSIESLRIILSMVRKVGPLWIDQEDLATAIWIECWEKTLFPTRLMVLRRVIDRVKFDRRRQGLELRDIGQPDGVQVCLSNKEFLDSIVKKAKLSAKEEDMVFLSYYLEYSNVEVGKKLKVPSSKVDEGLNSALRKLRVSAFKES
jgi:DNA-directed RNA polymerase specialized sigma24 family protein